VYFLPIVLSTLGVFPTESPLYGRLSGNVLPAALFLLLVGAPVNSILKLGPKALLAMVLGAVTMAVGVIVSFLTVGKFLPEEGWKMAGALLATWVGGSANMLAVKEVLGLSDKGLGPLIVTDTFFSYGWMAVLLLGAGLQKYFDRGMPAAAADINNGPSPSGPDKKTMLKDPFLKILFVLSVGMIFGILAAGGGNFLSMKAPALSGLGWAVLLASSITVLLALTPLQRLEEYGASQVGVFLLYIVLATMGAKTTLKFDSALLAIFIFAFLVLLVHGILLLISGRLLQIPLFLLATSSQANVGGVVSAPIVAGVYKPGTAHLAVLMAIMGALVGTYTGILGGYICAFILRFM